MGCGPDILQLFQVADAVIDQHRQRRLPATPVPQAQGGVAEPLERQLYSMYIKGEIDETTFQALKRLAEAGKLEPVDLAVHRVGALQGKRAVQRRLSEEEKARRQLRTRLLDVEKARQESLAVLETLRARIASLEEEAQRRERVARAVVGTDEEEARQHLQSKHVFLETKAQLEKQIEALEKDISRLDEVRISLEAKLAELDALEARENLQRMLNG